MRKWVVRAALVWAWCWRRWRWWYSCGFWWVALPYRVRRSLLGFPLTRSARTGLETPTFRGSGNGGCNVTGYDIQFRYEPVTDRVHGQATITARATEELSSFKLDLRLAASAVTVDDRPAAIRQDGGKVQITPAVAVRAGAPMTVRVDYTGVPSAIPSRHCGASP